MKNQNQTKLFAFKLAAKKEQETKAAPQWKQRDGVALAGCSGPDARADRFGGGSAGRDNGIWC
ncbi:MULTISPECIES: hypothetical protein [Rugamonas]|uniref:Uncharacterized protein n=1 Tax=Rugamonas rubra TaxID=758825 RepID=A0A1I4MQX3_9BURK|nr:MULTISPECIES: hypothetical protein [Rugamonas]WGG51946.1 hypothetical protein QC826_07035 [Rugamonas sp. DEMB1]SFM05732.1 hypothetical protein SAMN02982985_02576 [Rugamonas rubra]